MVSKKAVGVGVPVAVLLAVIGGAWTISVDTSTTNISDDDTTINQGDTNIFNDITDDIVEGIVETAIEACENDPDLEICK